MAICCVATPGHAQEDPPAASPPTLQPVVVTGFRASNSRGIATKRDRLSAVDSIAADEIGQLPDANAGDALARVTGVNTLSYQGEPRYVIIRGLNANYNATLIDGFAFATADVGSRQILMEVLPSNFVHRIDVTKSFLPWSDGGAIGGIADLVTAGGFHYPDGTLTLSAKAGENLMNDRYGGHSPVGEATAKWAGRFGSANEFALLSTASYWLRHIHVPQIESGGSLRWYKADGTVDSVPYGGNGLAVPTERRWYNYDNERERSGLTLRLDWRPEGPLRGHVASYYFDQQERSDRNTQNAAVAGSAKVSNQTPTSGTLSSVTQTVELGRLRWDRALYGINGELLYDINQDWLAEVRGSQSRSKSGNPQTWDQFSQAGQPYNYDWSGATPVFTAVNAVASDPSAYPNVYHREEATDYAARVRDLQINARHNIESDSRGLGLAFGARAVSTRTDTSFTRQSWNKLGYTLADVLGGGSLCGFNCSSGLMVIDPARADALFGQFVSSVAPKTDADTQFARTYGIREDIYAAYGQAQYATNEWQIAGGLRLEQTLFHTDGFQSTTTGTSSAPVTKWAPVSADRHYHDLLPSLAGAYATGPASKLRFGLSRSIGRPRFDQMALAGGVVNESTTPHSMNTSNVDLKPRRSTNLDLGHDWYLDDGRGMVSLAAFHKEISDEIYKFGALEDINGESTLVTQPRNAEGKVRITGLEFGLIKELGGMWSALQGFSVGVNATVLDAAYPVTLADGTKLQLSRLPQQPGKMWNLALYYEDRDLRAKLAWNHVGELWDDRYPNYTNQAQFYANRFQQATDKLDLKVTRKLSAKLAISLDLLNITGKGNQYNFGRSQEYVQSAWELAPTVMIGINYKL